ncbi:MAG: tRNA (adenosine(37)-N6)-threonylcarbamoyltransferase complex dimerization subunit type 1 TsaB [Patescibacteria group bacterium]|nr:tRNA (adenosine(37)-N6)-threonylcarbamoyltransferase complex dimerization subunit type 1 TsaB [Patescibacteria group bacterium]
MAKIINIDTSDNKKIIIELENNGAIKKLSLKSVLLKSEAALPLIDKLLKDNNVKLGEIEEVKVNLGPGSYTGLRVGAAIANTLGFFLKIPINGKKIGELVSPVYNK